MIVCFEGGGHGNISWNSNRLILLVDSLTGNAVTKQIMQIASFIGELNLHFTMDHTYTTCVIKK